MVGEDAFGQLEFRGLMGVGVQLEIEMGDQGLTSSEKVM